MITIRKARTLPKRPLLRGGRAKAVVLWCCYRIVVLQTLESSQHAGSANEPDLKKHERSAFCFSCDTFISLVLLLDQTEGNEQKAICIESVSEADI